MPKKDEKKVCCHGMKFPTVGVILLVIGILWLFKDLGWIAFDIPWWPVILIVVSLGLIFKHAHYHK